MLVVYKSFVSQIFTSTGHFLNFCPNISYSVSYVHIIYQIYIKNYIQICSFCIIFYVWLVIFLLLI